MCKACAPCYADLHTRCRACGHASGTQRQRTMSDTCVFCRIIRREAPAFVVTEDERVIVFLSLETHPLVVPKHHIPDIYSLDETVGAAIMSATIAVSRAVKEGYSA